MTLASDTISRPFPAPRLRSAHPGFARSAFAASIAALVAVLALVAGPATAQRQPEIIAEGASSIAGLGAVRIAETTQRVQLEQGAAWTAFRGRHGAWTAMWNASTGTPHRAFGEAIRLPGFADRADAAEASVRAFISSHPELFGTPTLELIRAQRIRGTWFVSFRQTLRGLRVLYSDWEFRVGANGNLFMFGADAQRVPEESIVLATPLPASIAKQAARVGVRFDPIRDVITGGTERSLLPVMTEGGTTFRQVTEVRVITSDPPADWLTYVDAATGEVLLRENRVRYAISGTVDATIHNLLPTDPLTVAPLKNLTVNVGATPVQTNGAGGYSASPGGAVTVSAQLLGPYVNVNRSDGVPDATFSTPASDPSTVNIHWTSGNSHDAERDGFRNVNDAHDYVLALDPGATSLNYMAACNVNVSGSCNAFYSPGNGSVNFYVAGGGCPNMATMPDVVYHEYGHGVNEHIYQQAGAGGMSNGALHEGMADVLACMIQDDSRGGKGFFGPGTVLRDADNTFRWPQNQSSDGHVTGMIISGAFWDLRQAAGLAVAADLSHFAKYGTPDDPNSGVAMNEYFVETLVADDNDANLNNGTPHGADIVAAFNAHGIGTNMYINFAHTALADQPGAGPYPVTTTVTYSGPFGSLAGPPTLFYKYDGGPFQSVAMSPIGGNQYSGSIPGTSGAVVAYYFSVNDVLGGTETNPDGAPATTTYRFVAGATTSILSLDMESEPGWVVGDVGDNATTGIWTRNNPNGTQVTAGIYVQPEDDHTAAGIQCFFTGQAAVGAAAGTNDVDNGKTTLTSATIDATAGGLSNPIVSYYRWYSNDQGGSPGLDFWRAYISNDGGANWVPIENTNLSDASWQRQLFRISDYVTPTNDMRLRFVAEDAGAGSLVEAAVDDVQILAFASQVGVPGLPAVAGLSLALASAHPAAGPLHLSYTLPTSGATSLRIYDLEGRAVRTLLSGRGEAGGHTLEWDGRDDGGVMLASGTYFARLVHERAVATRTLVWAR
ncbi:MAG TPA: FlgD immunoglobulin-like domain containing protein [Candidatus Eisenbacteria bacterium]|nr:FlgD immunoglobulin-like domain containing protein [Candidatus Eisenbacteria bacterium]